MHREHGQDQGLPYTSGTSQDGDCCLRQTGTIPAAVGIRKGAFVVYRAEEKPDVSIRLPSLVCLAGEGESTRDIAEDVLHMIRRMMTRSESRMIVRILSGRLLPVVLADSLLDDSSDLVSRLAAVDEDVDIPQGDSTLEVKSLL